MEGAPLGEMRRPVTLFPRRAPLRTIVLQDPSVAEGRTHSGKRTLTPVRPCTPKSGRPPSPWCQASMLYGAARGPARYRNYSGLA